MTRYSELQHALVQARQDTTARFDRCAAVLVQLRKALHAHLGLTPEQASDVFFCPPDTASTDAQSTRELLALRAEPGGYFVRLDVTIRDVAEQRRQRDHGIYLQLRLTEVGESRYLVSFDAANTVPEVEVSLDDTSSHERFAEVVFRECLAYYQAGVPVLAARRPVGFGRGKL